MTTPPPPSLLDADQCIAGAYNESKGALRVDVSTDLSFVGGELEVAISHVDDSIKIGDGVRLAGVTAAGALQTDSSATTQPVSGTVAVSNFPTTQAVTGTFFQTTQPISGTVSVSNLPATQPVSAVSLPLPTGASTEATLSTLNTKVPSNLTVTATRLLVDGSGVTQPVSGTFFQATQPVSIATTVPVTQSGIWNITNISGTVSLPTGASTSANQTTSNTSLASIDTKTPALGQALAAASVPVVLTAAQLTTLAPLSTITANIGTTNGLALDASVNSLLKPSSTLAAITAITNTVTIKADTLVNQTNALKVDGSATTQPVSGSLGRTWSLSSGTDSVAITGTVTATNPSVSTTGSAVPASATFIGGSVTTAAPTYTTGQMSALSLTISGALRIDGSAVTQPVSGTVAATQSGAWNITNVTGTVSLPTGASTSALQTTGNTSLASIDSKVPALGQALAVASVPVVLTAAQLTTLTPLSSVSVSNFPATQPVSGTVAISNFPATQAISAVSLPLPTGAATSAKQPALGTAGTASTDVITIQGIASMTAIKIDGSATTQPVSGTVTANQGGVWTVQPGNTANTTAWKVDGSAVTQPVSGTFFQATQPVSGTVAVTQSTSPWVVSGTVTASNASVSATGTAPPSSATFAGGSVTTAAPSYTTGQMSALSLNTSGGLRIDGSGVTQPVSGSVSVSNFPATQAVTQSGTWTIQPGNTANTTPWLSTLSQGGNAATVSAGGALKVDNSAVTQPVSGTVTANAGTNLNTSLLALETGGNLALVNTNTANLSLAQASTTSGQKGNLILGAVTTSAPAYTTAQSNPLSLTTAGALRTDSSGTTQPISGTVSISGTVPVSGTIAATQSGTWTIQPGNTANTTAWLVTGAGGTFPITATSLPLPAGAATSAKQPALGTAGTASTDVLTVQGIASMTALKVDGSAVTQPVSGTFFQATQPVSGTVTANQGGAPWSQNLTQFGGVALSTGTGASGTGIPRVTVANDSNILATQSGTWNITNVSGTVSLPTGASTSALQTTGNTSLASIVTNTTLMAQGSTTSGQSGELVMGAVTTAAPTYTTAQTSPLSLTTAGAMRVDGSATTQPVSGTVAATQSGTWTATQQAITKGTQGTTGVTTQDLKDAGRNNTNYFMANQIITTVTDTLVSLTGYKGAAAVAATTTPAVVTTGKTYRITSVTITYVAVTTAGTVHFTLRANTGGAVVIGSPAVNQWIIGSDSATAGIAQTASIPIPDGLELPAGTGIGVSIQGFGTTGTAAAVGYGQIAINGYEY